MLYRERPEYAATVEDAIRENLAALLSSVRQALAPFYLPPVLRRTGEELGDGPPERLSFERLASRLRAHDEHAVRATHFVLGAPGGGKTALTQQLQVHLLAEAEPSPCALVTTARLESLEAIPEDVRSLVLAMRPNEICNERWWKAQVKKGRVIVIVDAWNEILHFVEGKPNLARLLRALLFGNHRFNVLVTSRDELDQESGLRTPERYAIDPLYPTETEAFLVNGGVDPLEGMRAIEASGLELAAVNPFLLKLAINLLREAPQQALPRTRAGLFERTIDEAGRRLGGTEKQGREQGFDLAATLSGCSLLSLTSGTLTVRTSDLARMLRRVWHDQPVETLIHALTDKHLAMRRVGQFGESLTLIHEALRDFGLALAFRDVAVPSWAYMAERTDHLPADWVGLQADPDSAALSVMSEAIAHRRYDVIVDVLMANGTMLLDPTRQALWSAAGEGLSQGRVVASALCERLALLPATAAREALRSGLLRSLSRQMPEAESAVRGALLGRRLDGATFQRILRARARRQLGSGPGIARGDRRTAATTSSAEVQELMSALKSGMTVTQRCQAANRLGNLGAGLDALLEAVQNDDDPRVRGASGMALGKLGDTRAVRTLIKTLEADKGSAVRGSAANALGALGDKAAVPALVKTLETDQHPKNRGSAANALGALGDKAAIPALVKTLETDQDHKNRGSAASALGALGDKAAMPALVTTLETDQHPIVRGSAANALGALGDKAAVPALVKTLETDQASQVRRSATNALGAISDKAAVPALVKILETERAPDVRGSAANALGALGDKAAVPALVKTLETDQASQVRRSATNALGAISDKAAVPALVKILETERAPDVRGSAANALGALGDKAAVPALIKTLETDQDPIVRRSATNALGAISDKAAVPALVKILETDREPDESRLRGQRTRRPRRQGGRSRTGQDPRSGPGIQEARGSAAHALGSRWRQGGRARTRQDPRSGPRARESRLRGPRPRRRRRQGGRARAHQDPRNGPGVRRSRLRGQRPRRPRRQGGRSCTRQDPRNGPGVKRSRLRGPRPRGPRRQGGRARAYQDPRNGPGPHRSWLRR